MATAATSSPEQNTSNVPVSPKETAIAATTPPTHPPKKDGARWKRTQRREQVNTSLTTHDFNLGAPRDRPEIKDEDLLLLPSTKRILMQVPPLEVCLGKENLQKLKQVEEGRTNNFLAATKENSGG
jgi:hypothetical protein